MSPRQNVSRGSSYEPIVGNSRVARFIDLAGLVETEVAAIVAQA